MAKDEVLGHLRTPLVKVVCKHCFEEWQADLSARTTWVFMDSFEDFWKRGSVPCHSLSDHRNGTTRNQPTSHGATLDCRYLTEQVVGATK